MTKNKGNILSDLAKVDAHVITPEEYDEIPEITDDDVARSMTMSEVEMQIARRRGRPKTATLKRPISIRLDPDIVEAFKAAGGGWQSRINDALRAHLDKAGAAEKNC